jgi:hypothetical protein
MSRKLNMVTNKPVGKIKFQYIYDNYIAPQGISKWVFLARLLPMYLGKQIDTTQFNEYLRRVDEIYYLYIYDDSISWNCIGAPSIWFTRHSLPELRYEDLIKPQSKDVGENKEYIIKVYSNEVVSVLTNKLEELPNTIVTSISLDKDEGKI